MAVSHSLRGKVTIMGTIGKSSMHTISELGEWSITGIDRNMVGYSAFSDLTEKYAPGILNPGSFSFNGYFDKTDTTGQLDLMTALTSGTIVYAGSSFGAPWGMQFWANDDTTLPGYGYFHLAPTSINTDGMYVNSMEFGANKEGLCSISMGGKISGGIVIFSTSS